MRKAIGIVHPAASASQSDLVKLVAELQEVQAQLRDLEQSDSDEYDVIKEANTLQSITIGHATERIQRNQQRRRVLRANLDNLREIIGPQITDSKDGPVYNWFERSLGAKR